MAEETQNQTVHVEAEHDMSAVQKQLPKVPASAIVVIVILIVTLFTSAFFVGWIPHRRKLAAAEAAAKEATQTRRVVEVIAPRPQAEKEELTLPADVRANQSTEVFARVSGYLKPLPASTDIGSRVKAGQVIAEIDAPEVEAQLEQARATIQQTQATADRMEQELALAQITLKRFEDASHGDAVGVQEMDEQRTRAKTAEAALKEARSNVTVAEASLKRLTEMHNFEKITAPFDGVITYRGYDVGALISPGEAGSGRELFRIQDLSTVRVGVSVPQSFATGVEVGAPATLKVRSLGEKEFKGAVARSAGALDAATRTLRVEVDVPNPTGEILPGMYGQVRLPGRRQQVGVVIPAATLVIGADGVRVAVVDGNRARFKPVTLGRDFGTEVEVISGLTPADPVINNPSGLTDGVEVDVRKRVAKE